MGRQSKTVEAARVKVHHRPYSFDDGPVVYSANAFDSRLDLRGDLVQLGSSPTKSQKKWNCSIFYSTFALVLVPGPVSLLRTHAQLMLSSILLSFSLALSTCNCKCNPNFLRLVCPCVCHEQTQIVVVACRECRHLLSSQGDEDGEIKLGRRENSTCLTTGRDLQLQEKRVSAQ